MASPVAHSVIGLAMAILGWPMAGFPGALWWEGLKRVWPIWLACVILANAPDLDYLYGLPGGQLNAFHQTVTHTGIWCLSLILAVGLTDAGFHRRWWPRVWILALSWSAHTWGSIG